MAIIQVEGLGKVEIKGSQPTQQEQQAIIEELKKKDIGAVDTTDVFSAGMGIGGTPSDIDLGREQSGAIEDYLNSDSFQRLALEVGAGLVGTVFAPGIAPAVIVGRMASYVRPALQGLATRMTGAGIGEAVGAGASQSFDPKESVTKEMLRGFATGVTGEGVGALANKAIAKVLGRSKKMIDGADEAVSTIEKQKAKILKNPDNYEKKFVEAAKNGLLTPGLLQEGQFLDLAENISELSLLGGASVRYAREGAETVATNGINDFVQRFSNTTDKQALGTLVQKTLQDNLDVFKRASNVRYSVVDRALQKTVKDAVYVGDLKKIAKIRLDELGLKTTNTQQITLLNDIINLPPAISFRRANSIRSELLNMQRSVTDSFGNVNKQLATEYAKYITEAMDMAIIPDSARALYKNAQNFYKQGAESFNTKMFKSIMDSNPEKVYQTIIAAGDQPTLVEKSLNIINKRIKDVNVKNKMINSLKGEFLDDLIKSSSAPSSQYGDILDANKINKFMRNKKMVFGKLFSKDEIRELEKFNNALAFSQGRLRRKGGLPGAIFIQMKQSGAVMNLAKLGAVGTAGATGGVAGAVGIILAPAILGKMFTSPKIVKLLTQGMKYNQNQTLAGRTFRQIITQMTKEGLIDRDEEERLIQELKDNQL